MKAQGDAAGVLRPNSAALQDEVGLLLAVHWIPKRSPNFHLSIAYCLTEDYALAVPELQTAAALEPHIHYY